MENDENGLITQEQSYRMSTNAASMCKEIVVASAQLIQGKKYVKVEGWQAIAIAHGCTASSGEVEKIEGGIRAIGRVIRMSDGMVLSQAEGFVGDDETTWAGRAEYARRAMAQTRAISRACRSAFAHVVVMMNAGLSTTPAEEVPHEGFTNEKPPIQSPKPKEEMKAPNPSHDPGYVRTISDAQRKRFYAMAKKSGASDDAIKDWLFREFGFKHSNDITTDVYDDVCNRVEKELSDAH
jgi:hypothetical protein